MDHDVLSHCLEFVCFVDRWAFLTAFPRFYRMIKTHRCFNAKFVIDQALAKMGFDQTFTDALFAHKQVLTGSFLLSCLMGPWATEPFNDIDVVGVERSDDPFIRFLFETYGRTPTTQEMKHSLSVYLDYNEILPGINEKSKVICGNRFLLPVDNSVADDTYWNVGGLRLKSRHFTILHSILNHIHYNGDSPTKYISRYFDVNFCKLAYNGQNLQVFDWNSLFSRNSTIDWSQYESNYSVHQDRKVLLSKLEKRQFKYAKRGFKVTIVINNTQKSFRQRTKNLFILETKQIENK